MVKEIIAEDELLPCQLLPHIMCTWMANQYVQDIINIRLRLGVGILGRTPRNEEAWSQPSLKDAMAN